MCAYYLFILRQNELILAGGCGESFQIIIAVELRQTLLTSVPYYKKANKGRRGVEYNVCTNGPPPMAFMPELPVLRKFSYSSEKNK